MNYTIKQLAELAGVSTRTLRYYDQIDLLKPHYLTEANYRIYSQTEINKLQHILFLRELDLDLKQIKAILNDKETKTLTLLLQHQQALKGKQKRLANILHNLAATIAEYKGEINMTNEEKFTAFKADIIEVNEKKYGEEVRQKYGDTAMDTSNEQFFNLKEAEYDNFKALETAIINGLKQHTELVIPSAQAETIFKHHQTWLKLTWPKYQIEAHRNLGLMYLADPRFTTYYDEQAGQGATVVLNEIIQHYTTK